MEGNPPAFQRGVGATAQTVEVQPDPRGHVLAHVFKLAIDPFIGKLSTFRVHQGTVARDSQLFIGDARKPFKVAHILRFQGRGTVEVDTAIPGDICAVAKVDEIHFDAVLHDSHEDDYIHLKSVHFPQPMYGLAIAAKSHGDEQKLSDVLQKIVAEDPSLRVDHNSALNETVIRGLGDLQLRAVMAVMKERFNVDVDTRPPKIAYRETITAPAEGHYRHKKQTGGAGQFGEVFLRVRPLERGAGFRFVDEVFGGAIPRQFIPAVEKGVLQALQTGVIAGFTLEDIEVSVYDGKYHPVDSKEIAFVTAGKKAFIDAVRKAKPVVLEPIVEIRVIAPNNCMGDITADLSGKRCKITASNGLPGGLVEVLGLVPLSELDQYQSKLKSMTGGVGSYSLEFRHNEPVPARVQQALMNEFKPVETED
jgi:elongation factor G